MSAEDPLGRLVAGRPRPDAPSATSTGHARAALLLHARRRRDRRRATEALVAAAAIVVAVVAVLLGTGAGSSPVARTPARVTILPSGRPGQRTTRAPSSTPLTRLAADVRRLPSPRQPGDATLVVQDTFIDGVHEQDGAIYGGYSLYTDSGVYYYAAASLAELQQTVDSHEVVGGAGNEAHVLAVLARDAGRAPWSIRDALWRAEPHASMAQIRRQYRFLPPRERRRFLGPQPPGSGRLDRDSAIYSYATEALEVGAGRPLVRAAAMKALSTLRAVSERRTRVDGIDALRVEYPDSLHGHGTRQSAEIIWLDARTGVPIQERDGGGSATRYIVERVTAAHLPARLSSHAQLR